MKIYFIFFESKVCGEETSDENRCSETCGGAGCDGMCGTNKSMCSGLADSYNSVIIIRAHFEELYAKQEGIFKGILTKVR